MAEHIYKCGFCAKYTLNTVCSCGQKTEFPRPPKFSLQDRYAGMRRKVKKKEWEESGKL